MTAGATAMVEPYAGADTIPTGARHEWERAQDTRRRAPLLSIVIPTYNERGNIEAIVARIDAALPGYDWEIIYVDDNSPDGTSAAVRELAAKDARIRCISRIGRRGLSTAVTEGILSSSSTYVAVMDGDMQHDETLLAEMLKVLHAGNADIVIGSRYVGGGDALGLGHKHRHAASRLGTVAAQRLLGVDIGDPMSGFFMMPRVLFETVAGSLSGHGFKILLDVLVSLPKPVRAVELPMVFRSRHSGESKLDLSVVTAFARMLMDKTVGRFIPSEFILFSLVGATGVFVHLVGMRTALLAGTPFDTAQVIGSFVAMTSNFWINNRITFYDRRLTGLKYLVGLLTFYLVCAFGLVGNIGVAHLLFAQNHSWWVAGVAGAVAGAVWNYAASSFVTWRRTA